MILLHRHFGRYLVFIHQGNPIFATIRKDGEFRHHTTWTDEEKAMACLAIAELRRLQEEQPLPATGPQWYTRGFPDNAHDALARGWTEFAHSQSEDGN